MVAKNRGLLRTTCQLYNTCRLSRTYVFPVENLISGTFTRTSFFHPRISRRNQTSWRCAGRRLKFEHSSSRPIEEVEAVGTEVLRRLEPSLCPLAFS